MSRLNKSIRNQMLKAIISDSSFANVNIYEYSIVKKYALEIIKREMTEDVVASYHELQSSIDNMKPILHLNLLGVREITKEVEDTPKHYYGSQCCSVTYQRKNSSHTNSYCVYGFEVGTLIPNTLHIQEDYPKDHKAMIDEIEGIQDSIKKHTEFTNKVMGLLMSVNTIKQLETQLPQFVKYLPESLTEPKVSSKKMDMKEVLSSLNK
jgi:hypothetical protein